LWRAAPIWGKYSREAVVEKIAICDSSKGVDVNATSAPVGPTTDAQAQAKHLLRVTRTGALATLERPSGAPLTTLVSLGADYDGAPLLLLSTLARHTGNLAADRRGSLLLSGPPGRGDPLNQPRLTVGGDIVANGAPRARVRFLARNPKSKLYASFGDFSIFRMEISAVHFNGGFARAANLTPADILTDLTGAEALIEEEAALLEEINAESEAHLALLAGDPHSPSRRRWRAIGLDPEGLDLRAGARAGRVSFGSPAPNPKAWRAALGARAEQQAR
jgi:heme iron utilization protein